MKYLYIYLLLVNAAGFTLMLTDKYKARKKLWRIPEATLFSTAVIGGSLGILMGMYFARHKTKHLSFTLGIPCILTIQIVLAVLLLL